ncbi:Similar to Sarnp: SAP domain-containing ribonucleoprotein (Mus musculus) [Cotesia congregata]|uniref:Similar to Sarnp: SAP domain-containing ribonucleoprotein (Mus musculus) n=1 Tax=Cotesia congregata TaxID=51543 RepID=A0A8J2HR42_COTCN|nr:Similar to Sarnp: SAP domain-containing ribonucleoprotein (Mus musculus) [Cotesia congregata]
MADSSYEKGLSELSKMKVADLKVELKQRGLPTTGNKNELVERLQLAIHGDSALSLDENAEEILDEDAVLERKLSTDANPVSAKKIVLNRNSVIEEIKVDKPSDEEPPKSVEAAEPQKRVIKLSEVGIKERLEMRAKKFGVPLSESAKKEARSARFNSSNQSDKSAASIKIPVETSVETLKKRAERFGTVSNVVEKVELLEKIEKRKARFGEVEVQSIKKPTFVNRVKYVK